MRPRKFSRKPAQNYARVMRLSLIAALGISAIISLGGNLRSVSAQTGDPGVRDPDKGGEDSSSEVLLRQQYWEERHGDITPAVMNAARQRAAVLPKAAQFPPVSRTNGSRPDIALPPTGSWSLLGPSPISTGSGNYAGRIAAIAVDPTTSGSSTIIYAGAANGGVWKSTNNGANWAPTSDTQSSLAIGALTIDPNNHQVIYAGTGEPNQSADSYFGNGILKSSDSGASWTLQGNSLFGTRQNGNYVSRIVVNPLNSNNVFAGTGFGMVVTSNGGTNWANTTSGTAVDSGTIDDVAIDSSTNPATLYATVRSTGIFKSTNGGVNWTQINGSISSSWGRSRLAMAPSNHQVLYIIIENGGSVYTSGTYNGGYYTTNGGGTWNQMTSLNLNFANTQGWYDLDIAVDPLNDDLVYGLGVDVARTTDARGASGNWQNITNVYGSDNSGIHPDQHALAFLPGCVSSPCGFYEGNDGGVYYTTNPGAAASSVAYTNLNTPGLAIAEYVGGDIGPNFAASPLALGGTQDNGTELYSGGGSIWPLVWGGDGGFTAINRQSTNTMFTENYSLSLRRSTNGGTSWSNAYTGIGGTPLFYAPYAMDRTTPSHLVYGTTSVYETLNTAGSWTASSQNFGVNISALSIAPSSSATVYVGLTNGTLYKSTNANTGVSATYNILTTPIGNGYPNQFWIDPADPNTVYLALGRFYYSQNGWLYKTTNGGTSWTNIGGGLPNLPVNSVVTYLSGSTRVIVVALDLGVFYSTDEGATWTQTTGLPNTAVNWLSIDDTTSTIVAFTHGRSVWQIAIPQSTSTATPTSTPTTTGTNTATGTATSTASPTSTVTATATTTLTNTGTATSTKTATNTATQTATGTATLTSTGTITVTPTLSNTPTSTNTATSTATPTSTSVPVGAIDSIGVYRSGTFYLRLHNSTGYAEITASFNPAVSAYPIVGDWTGAGYDTIGVYDRSNGLFSLCTANSTASCANVANQKSLVLGVPNDVPLSGRWMLGAPNAGVGVFRPSNGLIYLKDALTTGYANHTMVLGIPSDLGLAGDWNGKGYESPGVYRPSNSTFYLSNQVTNGSVYGDYQAHYGVGGDAPVTGDWIAQGHDGIGLFRQSNGFTYLKNQLVTGYADNTFTYGIAGDIPIAGHWQSVYPPAPAAPVLIARTAAPAPANGSAPGGNPIGD